jgi:hypothetical protein
MQRPFSYDSEVEFLCAEIKPLLSLFLPTTERNLGQIHWYEFQYRQKAIDHLKTALQLDPPLPRRAEIRTLVRLLEGLP